MESRSTDIPIKQLKNDLKNLEPLLTLRSQSSIPFFFMTFVNHINLWMEAQPSENNWDFETAYEFVFNHLTIKYLNIIRQGARHMMALINMHETPLRHPLNDRYPLPESDYFSKIKSLCDMQIEQKAKEKYAKEQRDKKRIRNKARNTLTFFLLHINDYLGYGLPPEARIFLTYFSLPADQAKLIRDLPRHIKALHSIYGAPKEMISDTIRIISKHYNINNRALSLEAHVLLAYFSFTPEHRAFLNTISDEKDRLSKVYPEESPIHEVASIIGSIKDYDYEALRKACDALGIDFREYAECLLLPQPSQSRSRTSSLFSNIDTSEHLPNTLSPQLSPIYYSSSSPESNNSDHTFFPGHDNAQISPTYSSGSSPGSISSVFSDFPPNDGFSLPSPLYLAPSEEEEESKHAHTFAHQPK